MFQLYAITCRYSSGRPLHTNSTNFIIKGLERFVGCFMTLELIECRSEDLHSRFILNLIKRNHKYKENDEGVITLEIEDYFNNGLKLDFLTISKRKLHKAQKNDSWDARIRLKVQLRNEVHQSISNIIRHISSNMTKNLDFVSVGFPFNNSPQDKYICINFKQKIIYYAKELSLYNGSEEIKPIEENFEYPSKHFKFDLNKFKSKTYKNLSLKCADFNTEISLGGIQSIMRMYPDLYSIQEPHYDNAISKTLPFTKNLHKVGDFTEFLNESARSNNHLPSDARLIRFRYNSETINGNHSDLKCFCIKNLQSLNDSFIEIDLVKWRCDERHPFLELYTCNKKETKSVSNDRGFLKAMIHNESSICLNNFGIRRSENKEKFDDFEKENCRIRIKINGNFEISNIIRNLKPNITEELEIYSIGFSNKSKLTDKIMIICLSKDVPYYTEEFQLWNDDESLEAISCKQIPLCYLEFNLAKFKQGLAQCLNLRCSTFNKEVIIYTDCITKVYPELKLSRDKIKRVFVAELCSPKERARSKRKSSEEFVVPYCKEKLQKLINFNNSQITQVEDESHYYAESMMVQDELFLQSSLGDLDAELRNSDPLYPSVSEDILRSRSEDEETF